MSSPQLSLAFSPEVLRPFLDMSVEQALQRFREEEAALSPGQIAIYEQDAGPMCGIPSHVVRDARLRGEITGSRLGKRIVYERDELVRWVRANREER
jgi:hypothetical protein